MSDTDRIDLDDLEEATDDDEPDANRGDWFWRGEGEPDEEPDRPDYDPAETGADRAGDAGPADAAAGSEAAGIGGDDAAAADEDRAADEADDDGSDGDPEPAADDGDADAGPTIPKVPREHADRPAGMPTESGGAGAGPEPDVPDKPDRRPAGRSTAPSPDPEEVAEGAPEPSGDLRSMGGGPHGGEVDDMTMAITYDAVTRLEDPAFVLTSARGWADWVGIVGEVAAPVINSFQREHDIDADFFNGTGTGPAERIGNVTETSMFYAKRMVVVGTDGDEWIAEEAGWEFVPFEEAAEKAGWTVVPDGEG